MNIGLTELFRILRYITPDYIKKIVEEHLEC